ncbi:response regulator transcription factor [Streptomyces sp. NPDC097640]|uniref:response regulator transcription factor n=1 Tax=Streptomyces sp. NPDC097640 TaxID=3157229 RepID=UPI003332FC01
MIRVLIADDQELVRHGFRMVLDAQPDMMVVGDVADGVTAVEVARRQRPDVVLADIRMPGLDGLEVVRRLVPEGHRVVVVTTFDDDSYLGPALRDGASGYLLKRSGPTMMVEAVRAAMAGDTLISPSLTVRLLRGLAPPVKASVPDRSLLTARETEVVRLVAQGLTNAEIGAALHVSPGTVKTHIAAVQRKLNARNRVAVAAWAWASGLADPCQPWAGPGRA